MPEPRLLLTGHTKDLGGGFTVRRLLPALQQRAVGPFVFFDHFGPVEAGPEPLELLPRDLAAYRAATPASTGCTALTAVAPARIVLVNALTHGNEFCGMVAATHLLDQGVRPRVGTLTVSFANVEAYETSTRSGPSTAGNWCTT
jgi:hypothetical protein